MSLVRVQLAYICLFCILQQTTSLRFQCGVIEKGVTASKSDPAARKTSRSGVGPSDSDAEISGGSEPKSDLADSRFGKNKPRPSSKKRRKSAHEHCLDAHNFFRALHNAPPLKTDEKILQWANKRVRQIVKKFEHLKNSPYGENLAWYQKRHGSCRFMVKMWYDEVDLFNFKNPKFSRRTGHFTQLVWNNSTHLGCGYYTSKRGTFIACGYHPAGNVQGRYKQNVLPRKP